MLKDKLSDFVPGHPISGLELSGPENSEDNLFQDSPVLLTPLDSVWVMYHHASGTQLLVPNAQKSLDDWTELPDEFFVASGLFDPTPTKQYIALLKTN